MAKPSESAKHAYTYIPQSVQKSMAQQMQRAMPAHLQKYQNASGYVPAQAQKAMTQQMQKNLPSHLQKYVDPYMHQNVFYPQAGGQPAMASAATASPSGPSNIYTNPANSGQHFSPNDRSASSSGAPAPIPDDPNNPNGNPYDFIMSPEKSPRQQLFFGGGSMLQRILLIAGVLFILIILMVVASNLLSGASNAQKDRLLALATTETEIARVADQAKQKITGQNLQNLSGTVKLSMLSTKQDTLTALSKRGLKKVKDKQIAIKNPENDAALTEGEDNGRFDDTYRQLLVKLLGDYQKQLEGIYNSGTKSEKDLTNSANEQVKLLLASLQNTNQ